jgi:hypothetical protein
LNVGHAEPWLIGTYSCFALYLAVHARRLKHRVAELVDMAAYRAGMQRIRRRNGSAATTSEQTASAVEIS